MAVTVAADRSEAGRTRTRAPTQPRVPRDPRLPRPEAAHDGRVEAARIRARALTAPGRSPTAPAPAHHGRRVPAAATRHLHGHRVLGAGRTGDGARGRARRAARELRARRPAALAVRAVRIDVVDRGERRVRPAARRLDRLAAAGQAVEHADDADDLEALLAAALDRLDRGAARGDDVLDDQARVPGSSSGPSTQRWRPCSLSPCGRRRRSGRRPAAIAAQAIGSAPIVRPPTAVAPRSRLVGDELGERPEAGRAEDRPLGVDVVGGRLAAGQRHLADHERVLAQLGDQPRARRPSALAVDVDRVADVDPVVDVRSGRDRVAQAAVARRVVGTDS